MRWSAFLFLLLWPLLAPAATYTAIWCPVKGATWYETCIESYSPTTTQCSGTRDFIYNVTSYDFDLPDNVTVWFRVRAGLTINNLLLSAKDGFSAYSNTIQIIGGLTPPAIGGCFIISQ